MSKLAKLTNSNGGKSYRVITSLSSDELNITILDEENLYSCQVNIEDAVEFANSFEIDVDSYMKTLHQQLSGAATATISVIDDHLTVYKNKKIIYFVKKVEKCNYNSKLEALLENIFTENSALQLKVDVLEEEKDTISNECTSLKALLEEKVLHNANYEKKLLSSFVLLLNEKKRRIQYLTELIESQLISTIPSKKIKLDDAEEAVSSVDDIQLMSHADTEIDNDIVADNISQEASTQISDDEDEDILLRSPVDSPSGGEGVAVVSLPKREATKSSTVVSFVNNDTRDEERVSQDTEVKSQESVVSSEAVFSTQDILDRMYN